MSMIFYSPAKINVGLRIIERREDGFHNLQSIIYPVDLCDILEIRMHSGPDHGLRFSHSGVEVDTPDEKNLCLMAWDLFNRTHPLPSVQLHLHKQIPVGAGLGGGSSNAATVLLGLNQLMGNPLQNEDLKELASRLGSDCPFFLYRKAMLMEGRGEILTRIPFSLEKLYLVIIFPGIHLSTKAAYASVNVRGTKIPLDEMVQKPLEQWKNMIINDFEESLFSEYAELKQLKQLFYEAGALYASLSGSGSSMYGLFKDPPVLPETLEGFVIWKGNATG